MEDKKPVLNIKRGESYDLQFMDNFPFSTFTDKLGTTKHVYSVFHEQEEKVIFATNSIKKEVDKLMKDNPEYNKQPVKLETFIDGDYVLYKITKI